MSKKASPSKSVVDSLNAVDNHQIQTKQDHVTRLTDEMKALKVEIEIMKMKKKARIEAYAEKARENEDALRMAKKILLLKGDTYEHWKGTRTNLEKEFYAELSEKLRGLDGALSKIDQITRKTTIGDVLHTVGETIGPKLAASLKIDDRFFELMLEFVKQYEHLMIEHRIDVCDSLDKTNTNIANALSRMNEAVFSEFEFETPRPCKKAKVCEQMLAIIKHSMPYLFWTYGYQSFGDEEHLDSDDEKA